jgi:hypothetical protein
MGVLQYDPKQVSVVLTKSDGKTYILSGFSDDDFIEVERDEDAFTKKTGVDGQTTRAKNNARAGKVTVRLMQSSKSNDDLSALAILDEQSMGGSCSLAVSDKSGSSIFTADSAWVKKFPKPSFKKDVAAWEWVLDTSELTFILGGNFAP